MKEKQEVTGLARIEKKPEADISTPPDAERLKQSKHPKRSGYTGRTQSSGQTACHGRPCVYILKCKDGTLYTGWTNDFEKRFAAHSSGRGAKYTRGRGPLQPVYIEYLPDKIAAARREAAIKKLPRKRKLALLSEPINSLNDHS